jgi:glycosyltransferase involved in cell wall biosynthesis
VWEWLSRSCPVSVFCLARTEPGRHWAADPTANLGFELSFLDAPTVSVPGMPGTRLYLPDRRLREVTDGRGRGDVLIVTGWESPAYLRALLRARRRDVATVLFYESTAQSHRFGIGPVAWARSWALRAADAVLTPGSAATAAVRAMGVPAERVVTGVNVVDVAAFAEAARRLRAARQPGHAFLYVGQLILRKNVEGLLRAFAQMAHRSDTLTVVGDGPLRGSLEAVAATCGITDRVTFTGHVDGEDLLRSYAHSDTFVLPSTEEVWGLVANEALASGLHAVVSRRCGVAADIAHMPGVHLTDPDSGSLAAALRASRDTWSGPVPAPPILDWTPARLGDAVLEAAALALGEGNPGHLSSES